MSTVQIEICGRNRGRAIEEAGIDERRRLYLAPARLDLRSGGGSVNWAAAVGPVSTRGPRGCGLGARFGQRVAEGGGAACRDRRQPWRAVAAALLVAAGGRKEARSMHQEAGTRHVWQ